MKYTLSLCTFAMCSDTLALVQITELWRKESAVCGILRFWIAFTAVLSMATPPAAALFEMFPAHAVVLTGTRTVLTCLTGGNAVAFTVHYLDNRECEIVVSGQAPRTSLANCNQSRYTTGGQERQGNVYIGLHQVVVEPTKLEDAATYSCIYVSDPRQRGQASVSVLASEPSGESSPEYATSGENLTYSCRVSYNSSTILKIAWSDSTTGKLIQPSNEIRIGSRLLQASIEHHDHAALISHESKLTAQVPSKAEAMKPFTCGVYSNVPSLNITLVLHQSSAVDLQQLQVFTWNSSAVKISYCPRNVRILFTNYPPKIGSEASCDADAYPPAVFRWMTTGCTGTVSGSGNRTLTVTSLTDDVIHLHCVAANSLHQSNAETCMSSASTFLLLKDQNDLADGEIFKHATQNQRSITQLNNSTQKHQNMPKVTWKVTDTTEDGGYQGHSHRSNDVSVTSRHSWLVMSSLLIIACTLLTILLVVIRKHLVCRARRAGCEESAYAHPIFDATFTARTADQELESSRVTSMT